MGQNSNLDRTAAKPAEHVAANNRLDLRYLGAMGPFLVALLLWNNAPHLTRMLDDQFAGGCFCLVATAAASVGAAGVVAAAVRKRAFLPCALGLPSALCCIVGLVVAGIAPLVSLDDGIVTVAAALTGLGLCGQAVLWGQAFSALSLHATFEHACLAAVAGSLCAFLLVALPEPAGTVGTSLASAIALAASCVLLPRTPTPDNAAPYGISSERARSAFSDLWRPLTGLTLCLIIMGFWIGSELTDEPLASSRLTLGLQTAGVLTAAVGLPPLARAAAGRLSLNALLQLLLPLLSGILVLSWLLRFDAAPAPIVYLLLFSTGMCNGAFAVAAWVYLTATVHESRLAPTAVFGAALALCGIAVGVPALLFGALHHEVAQTVAPALTVLYLVATSAVLVTRTSQAQPAVSPRNIDSSCELIAGEYDLSPREREVLRYLARGRTGEYIADALGISPHTVKGHIKHIHQKMGVSSRQEIIDAIEARC